jgi:hypothetical protein
MIRYQRLAGRTRRVVTAVDRKERGDRAGRAGAVSVVVAISAREAWSYPCPIFDLNSS